MVIPLIKLVAVQFSTTFLLSSLDVESVCISVHGILAQSVMVYSVRQVEGDCGIVLTKIYENVIFVLRGDCSLYATRLTF